MVMRAALVFTRDATQQRLELTGAALTIGRGLECELRLADERVSTRHCRLAIDGGTWTIQDLRSTNRTFVNGEALGDRPRRLASGDFLRLGAHDARLFEAQFLATEVAAEVAAEPREAQHAAAAALLKRISELEAALAGRDAELARLAGLNQQAQGELHHHEARHLASRRVATAMNGEIEAARDELTAARTERDVARDRAERAGRRVAELEAQLEAQARKARRDTDDAQRSRAELESRLQLVTSELALARSALATASDNLRIVQQAYEDVAVQVRSRTPGNTP